MSSRRTRHRVGDAVALAKVIRKFDQTPARGVDHKRQMVAEWCRLLGDQVQRPDAPPDPPAEAADSRDAVGEHSTQAIPLPPGLTPRMSQTLQGLLAGDGEKQIAARLGLSRHTVHVYVKALYKRFDVCTRGELLAHFLRGPDSGLTPTPPAAGRSES